MNLIKHWVAFSTLSLLLSACSESNKPQPAPLTHYQHSAHISPTWRTSAGKGVADSHLLLQPSIHNNTLYAADTSGNLSAIDTNSGARLWRNHYKQPLSSNLTSTDTAVYIGTNNAQLIKVDASSGEPMWTIKLPSAAFAAPLIVDNSVVVKTVDGQVTAYHDKEGTIAWRYQQTNPALILRNTSDLTASRNSVIAGFPNGYLARLASNSGTPIWERQVTIPKGNTDVERMVDIDATPIVDHHTLYTATYQGEIIALRETTGDINWRHKASIFNHIALANNTLYATDEDSLVWAFDKTSGEALWHQTALKNRELSAPAVLGHFLFVGDSEGYLHVLNTEDGRLMSRRKVNSSGISNTPIVTNKTVIVLSKNGELYAFEVSDNT